MNLHEYQSKEILAEYGIPVPPFAVIGSLNELEKALKDLKINEAVVKVQVHAGGRGKAGGVKIGKTPAEIRSLVEKMLGMRLVTPQTTQEGVVAEKLLISPVCQIKKEFYLSVIVDRKKGECILIASPVGGVEIEEVALKSPDEILTLPIELDGKIRSFHLVRLAKFMGWSGELAAQGTLIAQNLAKAFVETDAHLIEINPLVETESGQLIALDAKISIDDNALFRQKRLSSFYDPSQFNRGEQEAKKHELAYIALDGNIGCMVNGAGLAMATMDLIKVHGAFPANFLDVGGSATEEKVTEGFKIILSDKRVKAILVNIFGGIMNCATVAQGIVSAVDELGIQVPLVVRMEGTNVEKAREILNKSNLNIIVAKDLTEAAKLVTGAI